MVRAMQSLPSYFEWASYKVRTDYKALSWILTCKDPNEGLMRRRLRLGDFDQDVQYRPELVQHMPKYFSRLCTTHMGH